MTLAVWRCDATHAKERGSADSSSCNSYQRGSEWCADSLVSSDQLPQAHDSSFATGAEARSRFVHEEHKAGL